MPDREASGGMPLKLTCIVFLRLAEDYSKLGRYMKAVNLLVAGVKAAEADVPSEYMPGDIPDDEVLRVFDFLRVMAQEMPLEDLEKVYKRTLEVFESREAHAYYEDQFEALLRVMEERL